MLSFGLKERLCFWDTGGQFVDREQYRERRPEFPERKQGYGRKI